MLTRSHFRSVLQAATLIYETGEAQARGMGYTYAMHQVLRPYCARLSLSHDVYFLDLGSLSLA